MAVVFIPSQMREMTGGVAKVTVPGASLRQVINNLDGEHPGMKAHLVEDDRINPLFSVAVDGEIIRLGLMHPVGPDSEVHFLPAMSGG